MGTMEVATAELRRQFNPSRQTGFWAAISGQA